MIFYGAIIYALSFCCFVRQFCPAAVQNWRQYVDETQKVLFVEGNIPPLLYHTKRWGCRRCDLHSIHIHENFTEKSIFKK